MKCNLWLRSWKFKENENQSLITILRLTDVLGIWPEGRGPILTFLYILGLYFSCIYIFDQYLFLIFDFKYDVFIIFVQYSAFQMSPIKALTFIFERPKWEKLIRLISVIEQESLLDKNGEYVPVILKYRKYCRVIVKVFWSNYVIIDIIYMLFFWTFNVYFLDLSKIEHGRIVNYNIYNVLLPFNDLTQRGRIISALLQSMFLQVSAAHVLCWDSMILAIIIFLAGQLKALRVRCVHVLDNPNEDVCLRNIIKCHLHYLRILECYKIFNSLISPVTFLYYLMIQVNYGVSIALLVSKQNETILLYTAIIMIFALGFQLFIHFFLGNELIIASENLYYGIFESKWVSQSPRVRRAVLLLGVGLKQRVALTAGPFKEMSLPTFVAILRTSYSFYTLLRKRSG